MKLAYDALYAARATGAPKPGEPGHDELRAEIEAWIKGCRKVADLAENDLATDDLESAMHLMRSAEKARKAIQGRIEKLTDVLPMRVKLMAVALRMAPMIAIASAIAVALLDLYDVGEWHHVAWALPAFAALFRPSIARLTGMA